jgi:UDP-3-O-[3-hydroxymyristoyl] glucosamine N-acyltransferase
MKTSEIADLAGGDLHGDPDVEISHVAGFDVAGPQAITFWTRPEQPVSCNAGCVFTAAPLSLNTSYIIVKDPKLAIAKIASRLHPDKERQPEVHPTALVSDTATVGDDVFIGAFCLVGEGTTIGARTQLRAGTKIGDDVQVGADCVLHPNVFIDDGCSIGDRAILFSGVVIGTPGFGYVRDETGSYIQFPQIGRVVIGDEVEIGANSCVDRGALGDTVIGSGTKIDNLVQIGHNVQIGKRVVIAAQTGISGSTVIEDDCVIGGQVGMGDHARVKSGAIIGSQAGVLPGKIVREGVWWGTPVQPLDDYKRQNALVKGLSRMKEELRILKQRLDQRS